MDWSLKSSLPQRKLNQTEYQFLADPVEAGPFITATAYNCEFKSYFGKPPTHDAGIIAHDGDDILFGENSENNVANIVVKGKVQ